MTLKLPRTTIEELERLVGELTKPDPNRREEAMIRLTDFEKAGMVPLTTLVKLSEHEHPPLSMYAITALGRNAGAQAVKQLTRLLQKNREGNVLFLETIVDALGETKSSKASGPLLELLGIRSGLIGRVLGRRQNNSKENSEDSEAERLREQMALPVIRALEKIEDPKAAELTGEYMEHPNHLVRWHTINMILKCRLTGFNSKLKEIAKSDESDLVREMAEIAEEQLKALPPPLNN